MSEQEVDPSIYRTIPGWTSVAPPKGYVVQRAIHNEVTPDYDPYGVSAPSEMAPGFPPQYKTGAIPIAQPKPKEAAPPPPKPPVHAPTPAPVATYDPPRKGPNVVGPSSFRRKPAASVEETVAEPGVCVHIEYDGVDMRLESWYHEVIHSQDDGYLVLLFDKRSRGGVRSHIDASELPMAIHVVGSEKITVVDASRPLKFAVGNYDICALPIVEEYPYVDD